MRLKGMQAYPLNDASLHHLLLDMGGTLARLDLSTLQFTSDGSAWQALAGTISEMNNRFLLPFPGWDLCTPRG